MPLMQKDTPIILSLRVSVFVFTVLLSSPIINLLG